MVQLRCLCTLLLLHVLLPSKCLTHAFRILKCVSDIKVTTQLSLQTQYIKKFRMSNLSAKEAKDLVDSLYESQNGLNEKMGNNDATTIPGDTERVVLEEGLRVKLKEEISSPFRKVRQFGYTGMAIAGALGTVTAVPQLLSVFQDGGDAAVKAATNVAVDVGAIVLAAFLWDADSNSEKIKLERYTKKEKLLSYQMTSADQIDREKELSLLPIQIQMSVKDENATGIVSLGQLQSKGKQNIIIVAGKRDFVKDAIISAKIEGADLFNSKEIYVVPVVLEDDQLEAALARGFGAPKESLMSAPYIGKPMQVGLRAIILLKYCIRPV